MWRSWTSTYGPFARLRSGLLWLCLIFSGGFSDPVAAADPGVPPEFQVKAVFLYNFAQFVDWPSSAFEGADSPLIIGVLGADPFGPFLDTLVRNETINGRALEVRRYQHSGDIDHCHVLFVSGSEGARVDQIVNAMRGRPVLTVCDWEGMARRGAIIRFITDRDHVRLQINLDAAKAAGLTISSKLLRSAEIIAPRKS